MTNAVNGTTPHSLGSAIEHLRARWGEIVAFGALLVVLGVAALCFTLPSTVATVTLNGVFFLVAGVLGVIGPTRLNYGRIVPMVEYAAQVLGDLKRPR